jgi:uncharacterized flavoprotein (TIGR03862 family)
MMEPPATPPRALVVGGGPAGLTAAEVLAGAGLGVTVVERMPSLARKFVLAGRGGLNLTHSEPLEQLLARYGPASDVLAPTIRRFGPAELRAWADGLGEATFVGTSGRVFPESLRATGLLGAWRRRLDELGVEVRTSTSWTGWADPDGDGPAVRLEHGGVERTEHAEVVLLCTGGASWPSVGADGRWAELLRDDGVQVTPLVASNCGALVRWTPDFVERFAGTPIKNVAVSIDGPERAVARGELMVVDDGLEGGALYAVGAAVRSALAADGAGGVTLHVDLQPDRTPAASVDRLERARSGASSAKLLSRTLGLAPVAAALVREATQNQVPRDPHALAQLVHRLPVHLDGLQGLDRAISTAGGVAWSEVDERLMLRRRPGVFLAGELLDWDAPTGGYLLQATFSTARAAAEGALDWLAQRRTAR